MRKKQRHYTREEIIAHCKEVARENRMMDRSPWTAAALLMSISAYEVFGFKGVRLSNICQKVDQYENAYQDGNVTYEECFKFLNDELKMDFPPIEDYTEKDITFAKKGSYSYFITQRQLDCQNTINNVASRYMVFYYKALNELYGYSTQRLLKIKDKVEEHLVTYQLDKSIASGWKKTLIEDAGIAFENPVDPMTKTRGSLMLGC